MDLIVLNYIFTKSKGKLDCVHDVEVTRRTEGSREFLTPKNFLCMGRTGGKD